MKKIFTLMLALACAMFVGVSCNPDPNNGGTTEQYAVTITVDQLAAFPAEGGEAELNYTLSKEYAGEMVALDTEATASWLSVAQPEDGSYKVLLSCMANSYAGTTPRETSFTLSYKDAKDVVVTVKQEYLASKFTVSFTDSTPITATANIACTEANMVWCAMTASKSVMAERGFATPEDYFADWFVQAASPLGYGGIYFAFSMMAQWDPSYLLVEDNNPRTLACRLQTGYGVDLATEETYLCVVGLNVNCDVDNWVDNTTLATPIQAVKVAFLPQPALTVSKTENEVKAAAGKLDLKVTVENPFGDGEVVPTSNAAWAKASFADGKLTINYDENAYAVARKAEITLNYVVKMPSQWNPESMEDNYFGTTTVTLTQAANTTVDPVTLDIEVIESHYDHILVNVTPSDLEADYYLNAVNKSDFDNYRDGDWATQQKQDLRSYQFNNYVHTGKLENFKLEISTTYIDDWTFLVYGYAIDLENKVVAGELFNQEVLVVNDTPSVEFDLDYEVAPGLKVTYNENSGNYELNTPAEGGTFTVKYVIKNAPEGTVLRINNSSSDVVSDSNDVLGGEPDATPVFNDAENTMTITVNPYDTSKTNSWSHYVTIYVRMYTDSTKTKNVGQAINIKVVQTAPAN